MYRSLLYVPAHSERFLGKAHERGADAIILDLEDAVPEVDKDRARAGLGASVPQAGQAGAAVFVRINAGVRAMDDARAAAAAKATGLVVAKADPRSLAALAPLGLPLVAMIEGPGALLDARACAASAGVIGMMVGGEDLATELDARPTPEVLRVPKLLAHYAAKAEGKLSFGLLRSVSDYAGLDAIRASAEEARMHGFDGATCVHPSAVAILNRAFSPSDDEVAWAERVVAGAQQTAGAFALDGHMIDRPVVERARRILALSGSRRGRT
jgi:citrate lyase subunit beta/citryl-CoA lyase